jgi:hypothetical protein
MTACTNKVNYIDLSGGFLSMRLNRNTLFPSLIAIGTAIFVLLILPVLLQVQPSITYFPEHARLRYIAAETKLRAIPQDKLLKWSVSSQTVEKNDLMQDFSLLYRNNRLVSIINYWQKNVRELSATKEMPLSSGHYVGLTVHQAELHIGQSIYGKEILSQDFLIVTPKNGTFSAFREPTTSEQVNLISRYTQETEAERTTLLRNASKKYGFQLSDYRVVPLDELTAESFQHIFPFGEKKAERITGQLWEGLYKTYVKGIQLTPEQGEPAFGSSMPLLLIAPDHMLIVIETARQQIVLLRQNFS